MSIYSIYEWMGVVGKYTGCFPLPGLYEKRKWSKWTNPFINYVIPALNFTYLLYFWISSCTMFFHLKIEKDLTTMLLVVSYYCYFLHFFLCTIFNHFVLRRQLVSFLKLHSTIDELLKNNERNIKRFVSIFFVVFITIEVGRNVLQYLFQIGRTWHHFVGKLHTHPLHVLKDVSTFSLTTTIFTIAIHTHPYSMYIVFQHILKSAFDDLLVKIKKHRNENLSSEMRVKKMRKYMRLYCDLRKISSRLDRMVSPLLLTIMAADYLAVIHSLTMMMFTFNHISYARVGRIISEGVVLIAVSNVAYLTKKSHDQILPAVFSVFNSDEKAVKTELQTFALQSMYFNQSYSASGFFKLDRNLILAIAQSLITQVVAFYKIYKEALH